MVPAVAGSNPVAHPHSLKRKASEVALPQDAHGLGPALGVDAEVAVAAVEAHQADEPAVTGHDRQAVGLLGVEQLDGARDNWFGPWPPRSLLDDSGAVPTEERRPRA